ncbi:MAG: 30S ribosomal protein S12 methylthiotransferase RimO [Chloroflexi bacterium]|nr:30S ribosomal protein S12 methylthiotransferase RimO [Chloroflexota bacterium]
MVQLGCPKNLVDGEGMGELLRGAGWVPTADTNSAEAIVVNTCTFIRSAEDESLETIRRIAAHKPPGQLLIVAGCLAQRHGEKLRAQVPEIDGILGTLRWAEIAALVDEVRQGRPAYWLGPARLDARPARVGQLTSAYLKISDGCDVQCAFCTIPGFKGRHRSKPADCIVEEARQLVANGVREIVLIGQDTTDYGRDLGMRDGLAQLLDRLVGEVDGLGWLRLMYAFPGRLTSRLLETIARHDPIVKYIDLPLQHAHPAVLARMGRPRQDLRGIVREVRDAIPDVAIRSGFIVGFPGETEEEFRELLAFLTDVQLDRVGAFVYSREPGTRAADLPGQVPENVKQRRYRQVMELQQKISRRRNRQLIGRELDVLVEGHVTEGDGTPANGSLAAGRGRTPFKSIGRSYRDAPEVDGLVFVREEVPIGEMIRVRITDSLDYDLIGRLR